jgi:hypothetical protein
MHRKARWLEENTGRCTGSGGFKCEFGGFKGFLDVV